MLLCKLLCGALLLLGCLFSPANCDGLLARLFGGDPHKHLPESMRKLNAFLEKKLPNNDDLALNLELANQRLQELAKRAEKDLSLGELELINALNTFISLKSTVGSELNVHGVCSTAAVDSLEAMYASLKEPIDGLFASSGDPDLSAVSRVERILYSLLKKHASVCPSIYARRFELADSSKKESAHKRLTRIETGLAPIVHKYLCAGDGPPAGCADAPRLFVERNLALVADYVYKSMPSPNTAEDKAMLSSEGGMLDQLDPDSRPRQERNRILNECGYFRDDYQSLVSQAAFDLKFFKASELLPQKRDPNVELLRVLVHLELCRKVKRASHEETRVDG